MTGTAGTSGFLPNSSSLGFEEKNENINGIKNHNLLPSVSSKDKRANFGRNTLYNPKNQNDLLGFPAGDALATSTAASFLVRPTHKPESRRGSNNSSLVRNPEKRMRPNSRCDGAQNQGGDIFGDPQDMEMKEQMSHFQTQN